MRLLGYCLIALQAAAYEEASGDAPAVCAGVAECPACDADDQCAWSVGGYFFLALPWSIIIATVVAVWLARRRRLRSRMLTMPLMRDEELEQL